MFVLEIITPKNQCVIEWFGENTDALPAVQLGTAETGLPIGESNDAFFNLMVYIGFNTTSCFDLFKRALGHFCFRSILC